MRNKKTTGRIVGEKDLTNRTSATVTLKTKAGIPKEKEEEKIKKEQEKRPDKQDIHDSDAKVRMTKKK